MNIMASPFETIATRLGETGFYEFFVPWIVSAAVLWGLLNKSKMFNSSVNGIVSLSLSFMVWAYLTGPSAIGVGEYAAVFVMQAGIVLFIFLFGLIASSMFYPKFTEILAESFTTRHFVFIIIALLFVLFFTSGMYNIIGGPPPEPGEEPTESESDINTMVIIIAVLIIFMGVLVSATRIGGG